MAHFCRRLGASHFYLLANAPASSAPAQMPHHARIPYRPIARSDITQAFLCRDCLPKQTLPCFGSSKSSVRHSLSRRMSTNSTPSYEHFFRYTSGRWLWDEESQQRERYLIFNVQELQRIAADSVGAQSCVSITKLAEGGYNKVFRLVMDDGSVAIARIPNPNAGPACKMTASEVATMDFVRILSCPAKGCSLTLCLRLG